MEHETFLNAIADRPHDDAPRHVYADWLEEQGDSRAEFLRLQFSLKEPPTDPAAYRQLCKREQQLLASIDPAWLQLVRRFTTPPPCRDLTRLVPPLGALARTTTRLHPHRAPMPLPAWASKIGGRFLWPDAEAWPSCAQCGVHLAPILQLRSSDVPDIVFPKNADLLQLFWCPDEEAHDYSPSASIWWRARSSITQTQTDAPDLSGFPRPFEWAGGYVPFECSVHPEQVREYPLMDDLYALVGAEEATRINGLVENIDLGPARDLPTASRAITRSTTHGPWPSWNLANAQVPRWAASPHSCKTAARSIIS